MSIKQNAIAPVKAPRKSPSAKKQTKFSKLLREIYKNRFLYLLLLPALLTYLLFHYFPMGGLQLAFKSYNAQLGIWGSEWVGFQHFERLFRTPEFLTALRNTFIISFGRLIFEFPCPIILAILLNEMRMPKLKKVYQTVYTFPHFLSWVIVGGIIIRFFGSTGPINHALSFLGMEKVQFLSNSSTFRPFLYLTSIWKTAGWNAIIYLAAIAGISPELYEAATVDGASRFRRIWHITIPGLAPIILIQFILQIGNIMNGGFDQIFNMYNSVVRPVSDILDTYVFRLTYEGLSDYGFSTAVGLFKSVINLFMLLVANKITKLLTGSSLYSV